MQKLAIGYLQSFQTPYGNTRPCLMVDQHFIDFVNCLKVDMIHNIEDFNRLIDNINYLSNVAYSTSQPALFVCKANTMYNGNTWEASLTFDAGYQQLIAYQDVHYYQLPGSEEKFEQSGDWIKSQLQIIKGSQVFYFDARGDRVGTLDKAVYIGTYQGIKSISSDHITVKAGNRSDGSTPVCTVSIKNLEDEGLTRKSIQIRSQTTDMAKYNIQNEMADINAYITLRPSKFVEEISSSIVAEVSRQFVQR